MRRSNWRRKERRQRQQRERRWRPVLEVGSALTRIIAREQRREFTHRDENSRFGDRAIDALSRARRAVDEAIRYGRR